MTQGYGPQDPNQPGYGEQQPGYGYPPPGQAQPPSYAPPPPPPVYPQQGYAIEQPGYFMGHKLANWLQRVAAWLIDGLISGVVYFVGWLLFIQAANTGSDGTAAIGAVIYLIALGLSIYNRWILQGRTGQSWGKQVLRLRLVRLTDGQPIGAGMAFVRDLAHVVDYLTCMIGFLFPLWDNRRQTLADKIVNTLVLDES